jgi:ribosomal protein S18 acetylase RimI-like enzyme
VIIRRATPADAATLAALARSTFLETFLPNNRKEDVEAYVEATYSEAQQRAEIERTDTITLLAVEDGNAIAFAQVRRAPAPEGDIELARFYVDAAFHGRGIAQALMRACEDAAHALGGTTFWLGVWEHNVRAQAFYAKCGFRKVGSHPFLMGSDLQTDELWSKGL